MGVTSNEHSSQGIIASVGSSRTTKSSTIASFQKSKPHLHKSGKTVAKRIIFHSASCGNAAKQESAFHKLETSVPEQAHKIQQRRKAVDKGKNTVGYDVYCRQVPKDKRRKWSMETPWTPDHTLDIPNKQWNGMVRAW
jgi:hypothetical protein